MARADRFVEHVLDLLAPLGGVRARAMFGGWGIYRGERMFALIAADRLYLKVDATTRARFADAGSEPFSYQGRGRRVAMSYWEAPAEALDDAESLREWASLAIAAADGSAKRS